MNEKDRAVALGYNHKHNKAPKILAKGRGPIARKIIEIAKENKVPVYENPDLAAALLKLKIGQEIPEEFYQIIAEVFAFIYALDKDWVASKLQS